jgi:hypothetical protein
MQLGETVFIGIPPQPLDEKCPFSHEKPNPKEKNELGGVGTKLGNNLADGIGVHTALPPSGGDYRKATEKDLDPRDRPEGERVRAIAIKVNGKEVSIHAETDEALPYPLTCAAHHLVPAQEALKDHPVLQYMCKDGEPQDFLNGGEAAPAAVDGAKVWGNVAYNVNGSHNGVWLPGNYAVGAGAGGVEVWKSRGTNKRKSLSDEDANKVWASRADLSPDEWHQFSHDPVENEKPQPDALLEALGSASLKDYMLSGTNYEIKDSNPKWGYVKAAMDATDGQFHDRHADYSDEVQEYLSKIAQAYAHMYDRSTAKDPAGCKECREATRPANAKDSLVGPPYGIVGRLVGASNFFKKFVHTKTITARNIYTSKWVLEWMKAQQAPPQL